MAEDQSEPGLDNGTKHVSEQPATLPKDESDNPKVEEVDETGAEKTEPRKSEEKLTAVLEQKDAEIETVKQSHVDDDFEGSQSIHLVLEDTDENDVLHIDEKAENAVDAADPADAVDAVEVEEKNEEKTEEPIKKETEDNEDAGSSKNDNKEEDIGSIEAVDGTKKVEEILPSEKVIETIKIENQPDDKVEEDKPLKIVETEEKVIATKESIPSKDEEVIKEKSENLAAEKTNNDELEVGIVGPPTAVSELLAEDELVTEKPNLPTVERKVAIALLDRVVRWVENTTTKADDPSAQLNDDEEEEEEAEEEKEEGEEEGETDGCKRRTRGRKRKQSSNGTNGTGGPATRKSQKVVSNIIRRSIRW